MGDNYRDSTTPLAAIFFKTALIGLAVGALLSVTVHMVPLGASAPLEAGKLPLVLLSGAGLGAILGGSSAACSLALHSLAKGLTRVQRAVAAGIGGAAGVLLPPLLILGPSLLTATTTWWLPVCTVAGALLAVITTRPLRDRVEKATS